MTRLLFFLLFCGAIAITIAGCSTTVELTSNPYENPITIDGTENDWEGNLQSVGGIDGLSVGLKNNGEDLYLAFVVSDENLVRQIYRQGLIVWFDSKSEDSERIGIQYPLGIIASAERVPDRMVQRERGRAGGIQFSDTTFTTLQIYFGEDDPGQTWSIQEVPGIEAMATLRAGILVYELRMPLRTEDGIALGVDPGSKISLVLQTPELPSGGAGERVIVGSPTGGGPPPGGGRMVTRGGGPGGPPGGGVMQRPSRLNVSITVTLADV